ncbi:ABC transporter ATP-binding protein [Enterovirga sp.]|jgi:branched-chain amino acid transport system ATP-binding protein|uniref:ABC transporter ATP-binding protein n=1 Tax=Enterovirga sp. TaxID=2026350 RepID=UPI002605227B|nr:ABC transporter ATP-binding protein [Enterovirga sp.]MDB5590553.1 transporter ATP-binding protein [Enterovirga sp.]
MTGEVLLSLRGLTAGYGPIAAVRNVSLEVRAGEVVTILGANGAGKSTTIKAIAGVIRAWSGEVYFAGQRINGRASADIAKAGIAVVPEGRQIFSDLTVEENLMIGAYRIRDRATVPRVLDEVFDIFPLLRERLRQRGGTLSGGEQQMLALGRALMLQPKLLLLDEPSMGLAPRIVEQMYVSLQKIVDKGMTALLVEQSVTMALRICTRGYVMVNGEIVRAGTAAELAETDLSGSYFAAGDAGAAA